MRYIMVCLLAVFLSGCSTTQEYTGKGKTERTATIEAFRYAEIGLPTRIEHLYLAKSGDRELESFWTGYPRKIEVSPGTNIFTLKYQNNLGKSFWEVALSNAAVSGAVAGGVFDGADGAVVGGAIGGAVQSQHQAMDSVSFTLKLNLKQGRQYLIMFYPNLKSDSKTIPPKLWVVDTENLEVIYGDPPKHLKNPLSIENQL